MKPLFAGPGRRDAFAGASLLLDFRSGIAERLVSGSGVRRRTNLADEIAVTRATPGTAFGRNGYVESYPAARPRFSHDPISGARRGLLVEPYARRVSTFPQDLTNAAWGRFNLTATQATFSRTLDGSGRPTRVLETTANDLHILRTDAPRAPGIATHTVMAVVRRVGVRSQFLMRLWDDADQNGNRALCYFDLAQGVIVNAAVGKAGILPLDQGRYLIWVTGDIAGNAANVASTVTYLTDTYGGSFQGDPGSGLDVWYYDIRSGTGPSSLITGTPGAATDRNLDDPTIGLAGADWFNNVEGTILAEFEIGPGADGATAVAFQRSGSEYIRIAHDPSFNLIVCEIASGGQYPAVYPGVVRAPGRARVAFRYRQNDLAACAAGGRLHTLTTTANIPNLTQAGSLLSLGYLAAVGGQHLNGPFGRLVYWPEGLSNDHLAALVA